MPLVDESGKLTGLGQVIGGHPMIRRPAEAIEAAPSAVNVSPDRNGQRLSVSLARLRTPQPALSPDRSVHPAPVVLPASGLAPYSAMVPVPLDSGMVDHDLEPGERRRAVPRAAGVVTPEALLSNTAYELQALRERDAVRRPALPDQRPARPAPAADQDEAARRLSDAWTRVPDLAAARRELEQLYHDTGDRRAIEAGRRPAARERLTAT